MLDLKVSGEPTETTECLGQVGHCRSSRQVREGGSWSEDFRTYEDSCRNSSSRVRACHYPRSTSWAKVGIGTLYWLASRATCQGGAYGEDDPHVLARAGLDPRLRRTRSGDHFCGQWYQGCSHSRYWYVPCFPWQCRLMNFEFSFVPIILTRVMTIPLNLHRLFSADYFMVLL